MEAIEESGIVNGTVVVDLAPTLIEEAKDARGAEVQFENGGGAFVAASFAADGVEDISGDVESVIVEFDGDTSRAGEDAFVDTANFLPTAFAAVEWTVYTGVVGGRPIFAHEDEVASVKGTIKLSESVAGVGEIAQVFMAGDWIG